jgi:hypothetical protein
MISQFPMGPHHRPATPQGKTVGQCGSLLVSELRAGRGTVTYQVTRHLVSLQPDFSQFSLTLHGVDLGGMWYNNRDLPCAAEAQAISTNLHKPKIEVLQAQAEGDGEAKSE